MKKTLLLFTLLLSAMNIMGQAYEFEIKENTFDSGTKYVACEMKDFTKLNASSPDIELGMWDLYGEDSTPLANFFLFKYAMGQYKNSFAVAKKIRDIALNITDDNWIKGNVTINLYLNNGDVLRGTNKGYVETNRLALSSMSNADSLGYVTAKIPISLLESTHTPIQIQTKENQQVICQQLRTYDIVKIEVDGVSFDVRGFRSAATFDAMFNALAQKTGKGHLYRYKSSSSANVSSGPRASCELGYIGVLSNGSILCRVDDLQIVEAKGKEASVCVFFEDANDDSKLCVFSKKLSTLPYDVCNYKTFRIHGNVNDYSMLSQYRSRRFKVTIAVIVGARFIYESNAKYITIYYKDGYWSSK